MGPGEQTLLNTQYLHPHEHIPKATVIMDNFDDEITKILDSTFQLGTKMGSAFTPDQLKMAIVATNLRALANTLLKADESEEIEINVKQLVLGMLGTVDFLEAGLPDMLNGLDETISPTDQS